MTRLSWALIWNRFCAAAASETVREFVNKRAAHWEEAAEDPKVKLGEVDMALDILSGLVDKYSRLLTGSGGTIEPELWPGWKGIFTIPWIEPSR